MQLLLRERKLSHWLSDLSRFHLTFVSLAFNGCGYNNKLVTSYKLQIDVAKSIVRQGIIIESHKIGADHTDHKWYQIHLTIVVKTCQCSSWSKGQWLP